MQNSIGPVVKRARDLVRFYINNQKAYDNIEQDAAQPHLSLKFRNFVVDSDTRWSSTHAMWKSVVDNAAAHNATRGLRNCRETRYPDELTEDEVKELVQLVCVLEPMRIGNLLLEEDGLEGSSWVCQARAADVGGPTRANTS